MFNVFQKDARAVQVNHKFCEPSCGKSEQISKTDTVVHWPTFQGFIIVLHSWQRSSHLHVTSTKLAGVAGRCRQLCSSDHPQVSLLSQ